MNHIHSFEIQPLSYDLVISHPYIAHLVSSKIYLLTLLFVLVLSLIIHILFKHKSLLKMFSRVLGSASILLLIFSMIVTPFIKKVQKPIASTIIAGMIDDKAIIDYGFYRNYYFIVDINRIKYGVKTTKEIFMMDKYQKHSTLDYTLYNYLDNGQLILYRFCIPEQKFKVEPGNLQ